MALDPSLLFHEKWYLDHNPDVAEALENGDFTSAYEHFLQYGNAEGRSSTPLFNVAQYLAANPDVAAAVANGDLTAHDHFMLYGASEGRAPSTLFDATFYLSQNHDVAAAVEEGAMSAIEHFLQYGQSEPRPFSPSIDLGAYLKANPDVAKAVEAGQMSALDHLMLYGASEGRNLGNGVDLSIFADDDTFQDALADGDVQGALDRVGEVAPFLPTFVPPADWEAAADTPIPTDFVPPEGTKMVIPPTVVVPPNTKLPDTFVPPEDTGGGGGDEPPAPPAFDLTVNNDGLVTVTGTSKDAVVVDLLNDTVTRDGISVPIAENTELTGVVATGYNGNVTANNAAVDAILVGVYAYTLADTLANLSNADADVVSGAEVYSLTDAIGDIKALTVAQATFLESAANAADYSYTIADSLQNIAAANSAPGTYSLTDADPAGSPVSALHALIIEGATNSSNYSYSVVDNDTISLVANDDLEFSSTAKVTTAHFTLNDSIVSLPNNKDNNVLAHAEGTVNPVNKDLTIDVTGENQLDLGNGVEDENSIGYALGSVTVTGTGSLDLSTLYFGNPGTVFDSTKLNGDVYLSALTYTGSGTPATNRHEWSIDFGSGDDTLELHNSSGTGTYPWAGAASIDGGDGNNTLKLNQHTYDNWYSAEAKTLGQGTVENFQTLEIAEAINGTTYVDRLLGNTFTTLRLNVAEPSDDAQASADVSVKGFEAIEVQGEGDITITTSDVSTLTTFDASQATGDVTWINAAFSGSGGQALTLDLAGVQGVKEIWTDATGTVKEAKAEHFKMNYLNASLDTVYGVRGWDNDAGEHEIDISIYTTDEETAGDNTTLKIKLEDTEAGDFIHVVARNGGVEHVEVEIAEGSSATLGLGGTATDLQTITITGAGDITLSPLTGSQGNAINLLDASEATGAITWKPHDSVESNSAAEPMVVKGGSGDDVFDFSAFTVTELSIDGGAGNDTFHLGHLSESSIIDGGTGDNTLFIKSGAIVRDAAPELANIQKIVNSDINASAKYLDLSKTEGLKVLETDYSEVNSSGYAFYRGASAETVFSVSNVSALSGVAGIHVALEDPTNTTVKIALDGNEAGSYTRLNASDAVVRTYEIETLAGNDGQVQLAKSTENVIVKGAGNFSYVSDFGRSLVNFDATEVTGNISIGDERFGGAVDGKIMLGEDFEVKTGSGDDMINLSDTMASGRVDAGAGDDTIIVAFNTSGSDSEWTLAGGDGSDTFIISGHGYRSSHITIEDFNVNEEDTLILDISGPTIFADDSAVAGVIEGLDDDLTSIVNAVWGNFIDDGTSNAVQFEHDGSTYVVYGDSTTMIELTGVDLGLSNTNVVGSDLVPM